MWSTASVSTATPTRPGAAWPGGRQPTGPDGAWLEPLTVLAMVGALTERVRLCPMVLLAALRRPIVLAKTAATIDVLTGGRLDLGVGVGWQQEEYEAAGLDFAARGRLLNHTPGGVPGAVDPRAGLGQHRGG